MTLYKSAGLLLVLLICSAALGDTPPRFLQAQEVARGQAALYRDEWGMPHIYASNEEDGYFGLGYATAEDRLVQILFHYLRMRGELARHFGRLPIRSLPGVYEPAYTPPGGQRFIVEDPIESDREMLMARYLIDARANLNGLPRQLQLNMEGFIAGVQHYMSSHPAAVPAWAPQLDPALPLALFAATSFPTNAQPCTAKLSKNISIVNNTTTLQPTMGSNAWALGPSRAADAAAVLGSDSHGDVFWKAGPTFYMWRLNTPTLDVFAADVPGTVSMLFGHSRYYGWAWTEGPRASADCYSIETLAAQPRHYRHDERERTMEVAPYRIEVKDSEPVVGEFEYTDHNGVRSPVVQRVGRTAYVVSSAYMGRAGFVSEQMYKLATVRERAGLQAALEQRDWYPANLIVAGADGTLLYTRPGRIPKRAPAVNPQNILEGNTSQTAWRGIHVFADAIQVWNPPQGFVANTNASPDMMYAEPLLLPGKFPNYFMFEPGRTNPRQRRLIEVLGQAKRFSDADSEALTFDVRMPDAERWGPAIAAALAAVPPEDSKRSAFVRELTQFDGMFEAKSAGALFHTRLRQRIYREDAETVDSLSEAVDAGRPLSESQQRLLVRAVDDTFASLQRNAACDYLNKTFGDVFRIGRGAQDYPASGINFGIRKQVPRAGAPLLAMNYASVPGTCRQQAFSGPRSAYTVHFGAQVRSYSVFLWGASEDRQSPHFNDQSRLVSERHLRSNYFEPKQLAAHTASLQLIQRPRSPTVTAR